jgi:hypothetical protein
LLTKIKTNLLIRANSRPKGFEHSPCPQRCLSSAKKASGLNADC